MSLYLQPKLSTHTGRKPTVEDGLRTDGSGREVHQLPVPEFLAYSLLVIL